jgi:PIN domain nuclease of toxin-antitoxin system
MTAPRACLLDRHVLLWWWFSPERLSPAAAALLMDPATCVLVSADPQLASFPCPLLW